MFYIFCLFQEILSDQVNDYASKFISKISNKQRFSYSFHNSLKNEKRYLKKQKTKVIQRKISENLKSASAKRSVDPVFHGHPKTREELWHEHFLSKSLGYDQTPSLIKLINNITLTYLNDCTPVILYDDQIKSQDSYLFQNLFKNFPVSFMHGYIGEKDYLEEPKLLQPLKNCHHFIVFLNDVIRSNKVLGKQSKSKVIVIARSSQWAIQEYLAGPRSKFLVNLLVVGQSFKDDENMVSIRKNYSYSIYALTINKNNFIGSCLHIVYSHSIHRRIGY